MHKKKLNIRLSKNNLGKTAEVMIKFSQTLIKLCYFDNTFEVLKLLSLEYIIHIMKF